MDNFPADRPPRHITRTFAATCSQFSYLSKSVFGHQDGTVMCGSSVSALRDAASLTHTAPDTLTPAGSPLHVEPPVKVWRSRARGTVANRNTCILVYDIKTTNTAAVISRTDKQVHSSMTVTSATLSDQPTRATSRSKRATFKSRLTLRYVGISYTKL